MNIDEIRSKGVAELQEELLKQLRARADLRLRRGVDDKIEFNQFGILRKNIARIKTIMNEKNRAESV